MGLEVQRRRRLWLDSARAELSEKGLTGEEVYDQVAWRRMSLYNEPT